MIKYKPGTFSVTPNKEIMRGRPTEMQAIYFWLCDRADTDGICFPSRPKIAADSGIKSLTTVDKYINELVSIGVLTKIKGSEGHSNRYQIMVVQEMYSPANDTQTPTLDVHTPTPNSTVTIPNNYTQLTIPTEVEPPKETLPLSLGANATDRLLGIYKILWKYKTGFDYKPTFGKDKAQLKSVLGKYTELQAAALMVIYFEWRGVDGRDEKEYNFIVGTGFSLGMYISGLNKYEMYARNVARINIDNKDETRQFINDSMSAVLQK
ncbi:helix-turn-helix domain-containing protein [Candidatus Woesebacteria bacterium]|nr:helix-turn-helix domain-containing protein [Candidatus Woesebacteria bacterium]